MATLRSDFYDRASEMAELVELKEGGGQFDLLPPSPAEIGRLIRQPALMAGLRFAQDPQTGERLDDVLRDAAAAAPDALPLLEFTLEQLYRRRDNETLTFEAYHELGGLEGALARHAEEVYAAVETPAREALPRVLSGLVGLNLEQGSRVSRRRMPRTAFDDQPGGRALIDAFAAARLMVVDRSDQGTAEVSVVHEALLQHWPRLRNWIEENREGLRARARLASAAAIWEQRQRSAWCSSTTPTGDRSAAAIAIAVDAWCSGRKVGHGRFDATTGKARRPNGPSSVCVTSRSPALRDGRVSRQSSIAVATAPASPGSARRVISLSPRTATPDSSPLSTTRAK